MKSVTTILSAFIYDSNLSFVIGVFTIRRVAFAFYFYTAFPTSFRSGGEQSQKK